jgi:hypothetical protein
VVACKPHKVIGSDLAWLRRRANEAAVGRKLDWSTSRSCGSAEHAVAFINAHPERWPDITEQHGFVRCERDSVRWKCEWGQFRLVTVPITSRLPNEPHLPADTSRGRVLAVPGGGANIC